MQANARLEVLPSRGQRSLGRVPPGGWDEDRLRHLSSGRHVTHCAEFPGSRERQGRCVHSTAYERFDIKFSLWR